jgi:ribose transport system permease protein
MAMSTSSAPTGGAVADGPAPGPSPEVPEQGGALKGYLSSSYRQIVLVGSFVVMILFFVLQEPDTFPTTGNIENLINGMPVLAVMAIGVTVVLVLGEFDLSVPNVAALTALIVSILVSQSSVGLLLALLLGLVVAATAGTINGVAVGYGKAPAFVVTLAVGSVAAGFELFVQSKINLGQTSIGLAVIPETLQKLTTVHIAGFELAVVVLIVVALVVGLAMVYTPWGRHVQAIGGNETAARLAGVPVRRTKVIAFVVTGLLAGLAGVLFAARNGYFANALPPYLLPAYAAAFFGAAGIGKRGFSVPATVFGALYLAVLANGLTVMNQPLWVTSVVQGVVLFVAVLLARTGSRS